MCVDENRFEILQGTLPLKFVNSLKNESSDLNLSSIDKIVGMWAILTNLSNGICVQ